MDHTLQNYIDKLNALNFKEMYEGDFFLTWEKTDDELRGRRAAGSAGAEHFREDL